MTPLAPPWRKEPIPAPGYKIVSSGGVELAWIYAEDGRLIGTRVPKPSPRQAEWLADLIAELPEMVRLDDDVRLALERYMAERSDLNSPREAAHYLLRDALIGLGLELAPRKPVASGEVAAADPVTAMVAKWLSLPAPRPDVELYDFSAADFPRSRAAAEGMTHAAHRAALRRAKAELTAASAVVCIQRARP